MAFVYYSESRLVPIFENNPKHNPDSAQTMLSPQAKVETDENQDTYNLALAPYVQVRVVAGTASGVAPGWWPNGWVLRKFLRKCLKQNAAMADHRNAEVPGIVARKLRQHDVNPVVAERRPVLLKSELLQEAAEIRGHTPTDHRRDRKASPGQRV